MDIIIDKGLETECTIHFVRSIDGRDGWDHSEYAVGGMGEDILRGLPKLIEQVRAVIDDPGEGNIAALKKALDGCVIT